MKNSFCVDFYILKNGFMNLCDFLTIYEIVCTFVLMETI